MYNKYFAFNGNSLVIFRLNTCLFKNAYKLFNFILSDSVSNSCVMAVVINAEIFWALLNVFRLLNNRRANPGLAQHRTTYASIFFAS